MPNLDIVLGSRSLLTLLSLSEDFDEALCLCCPVEDGVMTDEGDLDLMPLPTLDYWGLVYYDGGNLASPSAEHGAAIASLLKLGYFFLLLLLVLEF